MSQRIEVVDTKTADNEIAQSMGNIRQHLIDAHYKSSDEVNQLNIMQCMVLHDQEHAKMLGGTLLRP